MIYVLSYHPHDTRFANLNDVFNELAILGCSHITNMFLNNAIPSELRNLLGYSFIYIAGGSIVLNIVFTGIFAVSDIISSCKKKNNDKSVLKMIEKKFENHKALFEASPAMFPNFKEEI